MHQFSFIDLFHWSIWICCTCFGRQTRPYSGALLTVYTVLVQCADCATDRWQSWDGTRRPQGLSAIGRMKNSNDTIWNRTSDLPICSTAPYAQCYRGHAFQVCLIYFPQVSRVQDHKNICSKYRSNPCTSLASCVFKLYGEVNSVQNTTINVWLNDGVY